MTRRIFLLISWFLIYHANYAAAGDIPAPRYHGRVVLKNFSQRAGVSPVVFDHWLHRSLYTCRLCHLDIGFAMEAGASKISATLNMQGYYCGVCHDGTRLSNKKTIFAACAEKFSEEEGKRCARCHSLNREGLRKITFDSFTEKFPRGVRGSIDWEETEAKGIIKPIDFLEGLSFKRDALKAQADFSIESEAKWASDVIFSHKKHAKWNGCALCHPDIYPSTKAGTVKYSMFQIFEGKSCGVCHEKVAFSLFLCHKCHKNL